MDDPEDLGDKADVAERRREAKIREAAKRLTLRNLMASPEGKEWVWDILSMCGLYANAFSSDALQMAFNLGMQNVGQRLLADIVAAAPELYLRMQQEKMEGLKSDVEVPDAAELTAPGG